MEVVIWSMCSYFALSTCILSAVLGPMNERRARPSNSIWSFTLLSFVVSALALFFLIACAAAYVDDRLGVSWS